MNAVYVAHYIKITWRRRIYLYNRGVSASNCIYLVSAPAEKLSSISPENYKY